MNRNNKKTAGRGVFCMLLISCLLTPVSFSSCSESSGEEDEYANWQQRNEAVISSWASNSAYRKILTFSKDASASVTNNDYIYVEVIKEGSGTTSPLYTDTCRLAYRGWLIPTTSYPEGYVFDQSFQGDFDMQTADMTDFTVNSLVDGFTTALMNMHQGDYWRVHIPYTLGYGTTSNTNIPAYSALVFDIVLKDFWHPGETRPPFKVRREQEER